VQPLPALVAVRRNPAGHAASIPRGQRIADGRRNVDAEQEKRIELAVDALREIGVYTEDELAESRARMIQMADSPRVDRIARQRVQNGSGS